MDEYYTEMVCSVWHKHRFKHICQWFWLSDFALYLDLHFVVQWFCLVSWTTFRGPVIFTNLDLHFVVQWFCLVSWPTFRGPVILPCILTYISWSSDFALYLDLHFVVQWFCLISWPTFRGLVILTYILKMFWWGNVGLKILIQCDIKFDL